MGSGGVCTSPLIGNILITLDIVFMASSLLAVPIAVCLVKYKFDKSNLDYQKNSVEVHPMRMPSPKNPNVSIESTEIPHISDISENKESAARKSLERDYSFIQHHILPIRNVYTIPSTSINNLVEESLGAVAVCVHHL